MRSTRCTPSTPCRSLACHAPGAELSRWHTCHCPPEDTRPDQPAPERPDTGEPAGSAPLDLVDLLGDVDGAAWMDQALCAQTDPEAFFPEKGGSTRDAKGVCMSCLVRAECLDWALAHEERFGIWGGLSERERRTLKHQLAVASAPGEDGTAA